MVRRDDDLGRVVIPVELREMFDIKVGSDIESRMEDGASAV